MRLSVCRCLSARSRCLPLAGSDDAWHLVETKSENVYGAVRSRKDTFAKTFMA